MAGLTFDAQFRFEPIFKLLKAFPELNGKFLSLIGGSARKILKQDFLSGQEINLTAYPMDALNRRTIIADVNRKRTFVKVYAYPVNLFEKGRRLRSGRKEPAKNIITKKLKLAVLARTPGYITDFENKILDDKLQEVGLN